MDLDSLCLCAAGCGWQLGATCTRWSLGRRIIGDVPLGHATWSATNLWPTVCVIDVVPWRFVMICEKIRTSLRQPSRGEVHASDLFRRVWTEAEHTFLADSCRFSRAIVFLVCFQSSCGETAVKCCKGSQEHSHTKQYCVCFGLLGNEWKWQVFVCSADRIGVGSHRTPWLTTGVHRGY